MSRKIIGVTVGTPISSSKIENDLKPVKTINGKAPDENGNVDTESIDVTAYEQMLAEMREATGEADDAAAKANTAANGANSAASNANSAASNANSAATRANSAISNANSAARNANSAADNANSAADRANEAADRAENIVPGGGGGGVAFEVGVGLNLSDGILSVDSASDFNGDNTRPAEAALVKTLVGNVEILLKTI